MNGDRSMKKIKKIFEKHSTLKKMIFKIYNYLPFNNSFRTKKARIKNDGILKRCKIKIYGVGNELIIGNFAYLNNTSIYIKGNNNKIVIGKYVYINQGDLYIEDDSGIIEIGNRTSICGKTQLACIEGQKISIGEDCLFSSDINIRVGDSHSILDMEGKRINPSKSVILKDRIWLCNRTMVLKGVIIENDSIVSAGAIVTNSFEKSNVIIGGLPAKIIKSDVQWCGRRL